MICFLEFKSKFTKNVRNRVVYRLLLFLSKLQVIIFPHNMTIFTLYICCDFYLRKIYMDMLFC
jgi:hypothetical protein